MFSTFLAHFILFILFILVFMISKILYDNARNPVETLRVGVTELVCRITSHTHNVAVKPLETADLTRVS